MVEDIRWQPEVRMLIRLAAPTIVQGAPTSCTSYQNPGKRGFAPWTYLKAARPGCGLCAGAAQQAMMVTDQVFVGHLGTNALAAAALATTYSNIMWCEGWFPWLLLVPCCVSPTEYASGYHARQECGPAAHWAACSACLALLRHLHCILNALAFEVPGKAGRATPKALL